MGEGYRVILERTIIGARESDAYKHYLRVRDFVLDMIDGNHSKPSTYWEEELSGFTYMFDAGPLIIQSLREHCHHVTGIRAYDYRQHHLHQCAAFQTKLSMLSAMDRKNLFIPESRALGGFGHSIDGNLVNLDTLKFYEVLIGMEKAGFLGRFFTSQPTRKIVLEIGSGWGGFAYQFKSLFPDVTFILVDLPQTFLFSGTYLMTMFPDASCAFIKSKQGLEESMEYLSDLDFVFLPNYLMGDLPREQIQLAINIVSFQEMSSEQVSKYAKCLSSIGCDNLYSLNRERSPHNVQLTEVSALLGQYYDLEEVFVLDMQYGDLPGRERDLFRVIRKIARYFRERSLFEYRHLAGVRRSS